jgi:hypothetical protein
MYAMLFKTQIISYNRSPRNFFSTAANLLPDFQLLNTPELADMQLQHKGSAHSREQQWLKYP